MKNYLGIAAAGMLLFSACSSDEEVINNGNSSANLEGQELVMKVVNTGDGLKTRVGRPLLSSEADQTIDKVKLAIFKLNDKTDAIESCVFTKEFSNWSNSSTNFNNENAGHGKYASLNLKKEEALKGSNGLAQGNYMVYAVGYTSEGSVYTYAPTLESITSSWNEAANFKSIEATSNAGGEEIFAGSIAKLEVNQDGNFTYTAGQPEKNILYLHRQVAGAFGYFKNIPVTGPDGTKATHLRLVAADKNTTLNMTNFNTGFRKPNEGVKYVVNGENPASTKDAKFKGGAEGYVVYNIKLTDWFPQGDEDNNGLLDAGDTNWKIPAMGGDFNAVKGSVFAGNFVIPFANKGVKTFELQLVNGEGKNATILRTWAINLNAKQEGVVGVDNTPFNNESTTSYSIVRNHLYTIGKKDIANPKPEPGEPDPQPNPGESETEKPEDLSKGQILTLRVNDNWEVIHQLGVEPEI